MSFEELSQIRYVTAATLTQIEVNKIPASVTLITRNMIENSGARNLDELFEIFVPSFQPLKHPHYNRILNLRGNATGNDKFIILVNGRIMNDLQQIGPFSERFLSMLGDIEKIEFVRSPGSSIYGPGAISGVISITTRKAEDEQTFELKLRQGFLEDFSAAELSFSYPLGEDGGVFLYYGIDQYRGSTPDKSPHFYSFPFTSTIQSGQPVTEGIGNNRASYRNLPRHKLHLQVDLDSFTAWLRWTRGGESSTSNIVTIIDNGGALNNDNIWGSGYQQFSAQTSYIHQWNQELESEFTLGFDSMELSIRRPGKKKTMFL